VAEQTPVWNNMAVHLTREKEDNSLEKEGFLNASLPPPSARNKENGNFESRIVHYDTGLYSAAPRKRLL